MLVLVLTSTGVGAVVVEGARVGSRRLRWHDLPGRGEVSGGGVVTRELGGGEEGGESESGGEVAAAAARMAAVSELVEVESNMMGGVWRVKWNCTHIGLLGCQTVLQGNQNDRKQGGETRGAGWRT